MDKTKKQESKIEPATPESIKSSIVKVRGRRVIIDSDLAGMPWHFGDLSFNVIFEI